MSDTTTVSRSCFMCQATTAQEVPTRVLQARAAGVPIQEAWPEATREQREFVLTGYCPTCMGLIFEGGCLDDEPDRKDLQQRAEAAARVILATDPAQKATVHTYLTIVTDPSRYSDQDAADCVTALEKITTTLQQ